MPDLAAYSFREKRKNIYFEKQKALKLKDKVINKIINENKEKELKLENERKEKTDKERKNINDITNILLKMKKEKKKPKRNLSLQFIENNNEFVGLNKIISKENIFFEDL
jgi:hypothetical protein